MVGNLCFLSKLYRVTGYPNELKCAGGNLKITYS
jgi:hypothetical protein